MNRTQQIVNDIQAALAGDSPMVNAAKRRSARKLTDKCVGLVDKVLLEYKNRLLEEMGNPFMCDGEAVVLPEGTKFFSRCGNRHVVVVEDKPRLRTVHFDGFERQEDPDREYYQLAFPYVVYVISLDKEGSAADKTMRLKWDDPRTQCDVDNYEFSHLNVGYRNSPLVSSNDMIHQCNLPNIGGLSVCLGWDHSGKSLAKLCQECIAHFWNSAFNNDSPDNWVYMANRDDRFYSPEAWERASLENSLFVLHTEDQSPWACVDKLHAIVRSELNAPGGGEDHVNIYIQRLLSAVKAAVADNQPLVSEVEKSLSTALRDVVGLAVQEAVAKSVK